MQLLYVLYFILSKRETALQSSWVRGASHASVGLERIADRIVIFQFR